MHRTRFYNTLIVLILMVSLLAPAPVLADDLPPEKATPTGIIARFTTVEESPDLSAPHLAVGAAGPAARVGMNLILNGDAESDPPGRPITGWHGGANDFIVAALYGETGYPQLTDIGPAVRGTRFFHGSKLAGEINAWQDVDLSSIAGLVDTKKLTFQMSGYFGGLGSIDDRAKLRIYFNQANGVGVPGAAPVMIGNVSAGERQNRSGLLERSTKGVIPPGTRKLSIQLQMLSMNGANPNALADNLSFTIDPFKTYAPGIINGGSASKPTNNAPAAPSSFAASATSTTSIALSWKDNATNEQGFKLERAKTGTITYSPVAYLPAGTASHVDSGLSPNTSYAYRLRAYNDAGSSSAVTATRATLQIQTKPAAPASCWTSNTSSTSTMFFWTDSSNNEDYFIVDLFIPPGDYNHFANFLPNATYVTIIDLPAGAQINLRVRAHNALGDSTVCQASTKTPALSVSGFEVLNSTSYPIVYLDIDGVNQFPVNPMGLLPGGTYAMDLDPGLHSYEIRTGFWQSNTSRFDMYTYSGTFDLPAVGVSTLTVDDVTLEGILTQFSDTGMGYWEGFFWDNLVCRTAAFKFYDNSSYDFYVSNHLQNHGTYTLVSRGPSTFSLKFNVGNPDDALLLEMYGEFYLNNGPASWKQITYNYKAGGYVNNPFCP